MRTGGQWAAAGCLIMVVLLGVARPVSFEPDAVLGDRSVELHWMPEGDDPVFTGNLELFPLGEVVVGAQEVSYILFPRDAQVLWALDRWGADVKRLSFNDAQESWLPDSALGSLPDGVEITCAGIHPLGIMIAVGLADGRVAVWRPTEKLQPELYAAHEGACRGLVFKPLASDLDTSFVTVGDDGYWKEWGRPGTISDSVGAGAGTRLLSVAITREGDEIATGNESGHISIWPLEFSGSPVPRREIDGHGGRGISALIYSERADRLASADVDGSVRVWNAFIGQRLGAYNVEEPASIRMAYGPREGRYIAYAYSNGIVGLLDGLTARPYRSRDTLDVNVSGFAISPDGLQGYFGTADGRIEWWHQGECVPSPDTPECFGGYMLWRGEETESDDLELLRVFDFGDSTWGWQSTDTLRVFIDPDSIIARGGDTLSTVSGPHNGIPYFYSVTKYYWEFLDGGLHRVLRNTRDAGFYRLAHDGDAAPLIPRVDAVTTEPLLKDVYVVPNPYVHTEDVCHFGPTAEPLIRFYNLPERATVRIYTTNGELVRTLEHPQADPAESGGSLAWDLRNRYQQEVAPAVYLYSVRTPSGEQAAGFLTIVR